MDTSPPSTKPIQMPPHQISAATRSPSSGQRLGMLWRSMYCIYMLFVAWRRTIVEAFVFPSTSHINLERRRIHTFITTAPSHKHVLLRATTASGPGYIHNPDKRSSSSKRRGNGSRTPAPTPPSHVAPQKSLPRGRAASSSDTSASSLVENGDKKEEWHRTFEHLQGLTVRHLPDYDAAFSVCRAAQRPFECLSLLRYMSRDNLPRKPQWYEATALLAAEMENWVTALDTYILFERKEEVRRWADACVFLLVSM